MDRQELDRYRETVGRLRELARKAEGGDKDASSEMRLILEEHPQLAWRLFDFARVAEHGLMERGLGEGQPSVKAPLRLQMEAMRAEIAGEDPSPLERLLAERVVITWLEVQTFQALYYQNGDRLTLAQAEYHQKRLDRAHRRHLSAIKTLAQVRKMGPAVQINIADKQINTAGG
jgi:hypothetical protein